MKTRHALAALSLAAAGGLVTGCGSEGVSGGCPTETPPIQAIQSCTAQPGATVSVNVRTCPSCNQTGISCAVDLRDAATSGVILLDPVAQVCEGSTSCPPGCELDTIVCTFTAPSAPDTYQLHVFDPTTQTVKVGDLDVVAASGPVACAF
jgi:hypothetical protein